MAEHDRPVPGSPQPRSIGSTIGEGITHADEQCLCDRAAAAGVSHYAAHATAPGARRQSTLNMRSQLTIIIDVLPGSPWFDDTFLV
jgi:hypothetical protein